MSAERLERAKTDVAPEQAHVQHGGVDAVLPHDESREERRRRAASSTDAGRGRQEAEAVHDPEQAQAVEHGADHVHLLARAPRPTRPSSSTG